MANIRDVLNAAKGGDNERVAFMPPLYDEHAQRLGMRVFGVGEKLDSKSQEYKDPEDGTVEVVQTWDYFQTKVPGAVRIDITEQKPGQEKPTLVARTWQVGGLDITPRE